MNYSWKQWKRGLLVSVITGLCSGVAGLAIGITWKQAGYLVGGTVAKDVFLYLKTHPEDSIQDTAFITKASVQRDTPSGLGIEEEHLHATLPVEPPKP